MAVTDEKLAERVRGVLAGAGSVEEKKMFGGLAFMVDGNMCCGIRGDELVVRVGKERQDACLAEPHTRPFDFTGKPLGGFVVVEPEGNADEAQFGKLAGMALAFVKELPPKT